MRSWRILDTGYSLDFYPLVGRAPTTLWALKNGLHSDTLDNCSHISSFQFPAKAHVQKKPAPKEAGFSICNPYRLKPKLSKVLYFKNNNAEKITSR